MRTYGDVTEVAETRNNYNLELKETQRIWIIVKKWKKRMKYKVDK
jgi:hypothetical protein